MRKFIISDIHGVGNFYYPVMGYLDNISKNEEIELYINGDLTDRGLESGYVLLDLINRIKENKYKIVYLGGNHELLMYDYYNLEKDGKVDYYNDWYDNGGFITDDQLGEIFNYDENKIYEIMDKIGELEIYHKFEEKMNGKNIVLVHAGCPLKVEDKCNLKIKNKDKVFSYLWARKNGPFMPFRCRIGNKDYFSIVGHSPNNSELGFEYHEDENYLNIDGGCSKYAAGYFDEDHFPLVEVKNEELRILTFNSKNEITHGNYFKDNKVIPFTKKELKESREYLNKDIKTKKLMFILDGVIGYEEWLEEERVLRKK